MQLFRPIVFPRIAEKESDLQTARKTWNETLPRHFDYLGNGIEYQIRGVVDVPSPPCGDDERGLLANVLFMPPKSRTRRSAQSRLHGWVATSGGDGVRIDKCGTIPTLTDEDICDLKVFTPPDIEEVDESETISSERHNEWVREYGANRYCRYVSRPELNQRYQDILVNTLVLQPSGKMGLTTDEYWYQLQQHVITELLLRAEPPSPSNRDPRVEEARPFFDGELCRKAANVVSARGTDHDVVVKYGKREHMEALYQSGQVYMNSASNYNESTHNQAVWDDELEIAFKGGYVRATRPTQFYDRDNVPPESTIERGVGFRPIYECPDLEEREYATMPIQMCTDYWMSCMADVLDQRLFADFEADSCVIIRRQPFVERLARVGFLLPNVKMSFGRVNYVAPLGAFPKGIPVARSMPIHMTKVFRYAYQREVRFVCLPNKFKERLEPRCLEIGAISDIAEFVSLYAAALL